MHLNGTVPAGDGRSASTQAGYQIAGLGMTLGMAIVSGIITGLILKLPIFEQIKETSQMFEDDLYFQMPDTLTGTQMNDLTQTEPHNE